MIYIAFFILFFTVIQLLVALANLVFEPKLPKQQINYNQLVSILIQARNEENNIQNLLNDLANQDYQNMEQEPLIPALLLELSQISE